MVLEPIRFRYSTESVVDEAPKAAEALQAGEQKAEEPKPPRQRRQDRPKEEPNANGGPQQANGGPQQANRPPRRRNNYRGYRKPNKPQE